MLADDLRKSVLQAAVQGKLTVQLPTDGDASDLLKNIQAEKAKLIKDKKIKSVTLPPISDDEVPFKIPPNWCWVRLGDVCNYGVNETISPQNMEIGKFLLDLEDIEKDSGKLIKKKFFDGSNAKSSKNIFKRGQVLLGKLRVYLNKVIIADDDGYCTSEILSLDFGKYIFNRYAQIVLMSPMFVKYATRNSYGTKMPRLGTKYGQLALFPLPPLAEQERIVAKLDEILSEIELLADDERELVELEKNFPRQMKNSLLQAAIHGLLTEQLPTDGNASDLLKNIRAEKAKLIKDKKIKPVSLPPISDDEIPFKIPPNWCWVRLGNIFNFIDYRGKTPHKINNGVPLITAKNVKDGYNDYSIQEYISEDEYKLRQTRGISAKGDILFTTEAPLGNVSIADLEKFSTGQRIITLQALDKNSVNNKLMMYFFLSNSFQKTLAQKKTGTTVAGIKADKLKNLLVPLPPLAEQERIVVRLDELLPLCDS